MIISRTVQRINTPVILLRGHRLQLLLLIHLFTKHSNLGITGSQFMREFCLHREVCIGYNGAIAFIDCF